MKTLIFLAASAALLVLLVPVQALTNSKGAPAARTGGPGDQALSCSASGCHDEAGDNTGGGALIITTPAGFSPGQTVDFTIRVEQAGANRFGFQATVRRASTFGVTGTLHLTEETEFSDALGDYITHNQAKEADGGAEWTFQWTAPDQDIGDIIIFASGVAGNGNGTRFGDFVYTTSATMPTRVSNEKEMLPTYFTLDPAYPNPFDAHVTISYSLARPEPVRLALYDALGRLVQSFDEGFQPAGIHEVRIDGADLPAGTYFYEMQTATGRTSRAIIKTR